MNSIHFIWKRNQECVLFQCFNLKVCNDCSQAVIFGMLNLKSLHFSYTCTYSINTASGLSGGGGGGGGGSSVCKAENLITSELLLGCLFVFDVLVLKIEHLPYFGRNPLDVTVYMMVNYWKYLL